MDDCLSFAQIAAPVAPSRSLLISGSEVACDLSTVPAEIAAPL